MPDKPLKIAIYSGDIPSSTFIERLIEGLAERGCRIFLFGNRARNYRPAEGVSVFATPKGPVSRTIFVVIYLMRLFLQCPKDLWQLYRYLTNEHGEAGFKELFFRMSFILPVITSRPDIFHIQWAKSVFAWEFLQTYFGIPVLVSLRGSQINIAPVTEEGTREKFQVFLPRIKSFHAVSHSLFNNSVPLGAEAEHIKIIYAGLPEFFFELPPRPFKPLLPGEELQIISVGKYHWVKGGMYALDAMKILKDRGIKFQYTVVGGTSEEAVYQVAELGLEGEVQILGRLPNAKVLELLKNADLFLLPSVSEGLANAALEAMALGIPVISTDCGGMTELVEDGQNGLIIPIRNPLAMADRIEQFMAMTSIQIQQLVLAGRQTVEQRFRERRLIDEMLNLYHQTLA